MPSRADREAAKFSKITAARIVNAHLLGGASVTPRPLDINEFRDYFTPASGGRLSTEIQDVEGLTSNRNVRLMAERSAEAADHAVRHGLDEAALQFYPNERAQAASIGEQFNGARQTANLKLYFPTQPELAGHLLLGGYSQKTSEARRNNLVQQSAKTGLILPHIASSRMQSAIDNDIHPLDLFSNLKLHDFIGSSLNPETWTGEWKGRQQGLGYTQDRHQHDIHFDMPFGEQERGISGSSSGSSVRRYRVHQAADLLAHKMFDPEGRISRPGFQALGWVGWRGAAD